jgi:ATP-dependent protease ClpP protease subunit
LFLHINSEEIQHLQFLGTALNGETANLLTTQLIFLESEDPDKGINFYINLPGGLVTTGMDRDCLMSGLEVREYGLIDHVILDHVIRNRDDLEHLDERDK